MIALIQLPLLSQREFNAVLAGLRMLQRSLEEGEALPEELLDDGDVEPLDEIEIEDLCDRLNDV